MKAAVLLCAVLLAGCSMMDEAESASAGSDCDAGKVSDAVGTRTDPQSLGPRAGARAVRVIRPGQAVTMDYRADRLNVEIDSADTITAVRCG